MKDEGRASRAEFRELFGLRRLMRRRRRRAKLGKARRQVQSALQDGILSPVIGAALLEHLEILERDCAHTEVD